MKIGIVGRSGTMILLDKYIGPSTALIEYVHYPCEENTIKDVLDKAQSETDAIFFTGKAIMSVASSLVLPVVPWNCVKRTPTAIITTLFKVYYELGCIDRMSFNLADFSEERMAGIISEINDCPADEITLFRHESYTTGDDVKSAIEFHLDKLSSGQASYCLSGTSRVVNAVRNAGYKAYWVAPVSEEIQHSINNLVMEHNDRLNRKGDDSSKIAVVTIQLVMSENFPDFGISQNRIRLEYVIKRTLLLYANECSASFEQEHGDIFNIYMTKTSLHITTENLTRFDLIHVLKTVSDTMKVFIGVGMGSTPGLAKNNAVKCRKAALENNADYFIKEDNGALQGPFWVNTTNDGTEKVLRKSELDKISDETGVGLLNLETISNAKKHFGFDTVTPGELADMCRLSKNNMNRIIVSLESKGYVQVVGMRPVNGRGRPKRILRILF